jgi:hypothetical protein
MAGPARGNSHLSSRLSTWPGFPRTTPSWEMPIRAPAAACSPCREHPGRLVPVSDGSHQEDDRHRNRQGCTVLTRRTSSRKSTT